MTVLGIAARIGIMLVVHYRHLEQEEDMRCGPELVLRGAEERLAPNSDDCAGHRPGAGADHHWRQSIRA